MESIRARRSKNISEKLRVVSEGDKRDAAKARLDALENDDAVPAEDTAAGSDEEFELEDSEEEGGQLCDLAFTYNLLIWKASQINEMHIISILQEALTLR